MTTSIPLQLPYSERWMKGYLNVNPEGRKTLVLYNSPSDRSSTQYARYLLAVSLGRYLTETEEVDHIDDDKTNDDISNLQVLCKKANIEKSRPTVYLTGHCPICGVEITKKLSELRPRARKERLISGTLT